MSAITGQPFPGTQVVLWSLVVVVSAGILSAFDRILVGPQAQAARPEISPAGDPRPQPAVRLSAREQQVLELVAEGYSNTMIATRLHLSESTIKTYMETLLTRFNARNRAEAVAAASRLNIL
jgi:DNA-binding NarL/FixJ family response regulator